MEHPTDSLAASARYEPVFQHVHHRRILLAQQYNLAQRYLPSGTLQPFNRGGRPRHYLHRQALAPVQQTSLLVRNSALEETVRYWNGLPETLIGRPLQSLKQKLAETNYLNRDDQTSAMQAAILLL